VTGSRGLVLLLLLAFGALTLPSSSPLAGTAAGRTLYIAPQGSDGGTCSQQAPCASLDRAYQVAAPGDVVEVAGGTYPDQRLSLDPSKTSEDDVVFRPAPNASVVTGELDFGGRPAPTAASHVTIDGQGRWASGDVLFFLRDPSRPASDITLENLKLQRDSGVFIHGADRVTLRNVEIGPSCCGTDGMNLTPDDVGDVHRDVTNLLLDHVTIHDIVRLCAQDKTAPPTCHDVPEAHTDCIQAWSGVNVTIRDSRFFNCSTSSLLVEGGFGGTVSNWTVENNMFGPSAENSVNFIFFVGNQPGLVRGTSRVAYNSLAGSIKADPEAFAPGAGIDVVGNITIVGGGCSEGLRYSHNLFTDGKRCGPTDRSGNAAFVSNTPYGTDLHLEPTSAAIGAGDPRVHPTADIDGDPRPRRRAPDAGADQREPAEIIAGRAIGGIALGSTLASVEGHYGKVRVKPSKGTGLSVATYRVRGAGALRVYYRGTRVVGVSTRSGYYTTDKGAGPGALAPARTGIWDPCTKAYRVRRGRTSTLFETLRGKKSAKVAEVVIGSAPLDASGWPLRCAD
jgi:hypothetical protein